MMTKKYLFITSMIGVATILIINLSCNKGINVSPPSVMSMFSTTNSDLVISRLPTPVDTIPLILTQAAKNNVTVSISVTSTTGAESGKEYTLSSTTATFKAGFSVPENPIVLSLNTNEYQGGRVDTLIFTINTSDNGGIPVLPQSQTLKMAVQLFTCPFNINDFAGTFNVTTDPWADFSQNGYSTAQITVVNDSTLSFLSPVASSYGSHNRVLLHINTYSLEITVNTPDYGDYGSGEVTVTSDGGISKNYIDPCASTINLNLDYNIPGDQIYTNYPLVLTKQQ